MQTSGIIPTLPGCLLIIVARAQSAAFLLTCDGLCGAKIDVGSQALVFVRRWQKGGGFLCSGSHTTVETQRKYEISVRISLLGHDGSEGPSLNSPRRF